MSFSLEVFQLRDKLSDLGEVVSDKCLTTIILDALSEETYSTKSAVNKRPRLRA